jgi:hypothetical protein
MVDAATGMGTVERRLFKIGVILVLLGSVPAGIFGGARAVFSALLGGALAGSSLYWLRGTVGSLLLSDHKASRKRVLTGFLLRVLLLPLILYVMIRFLFLNIPATVAGFALFYGGILVEGVFESVSRSPR